MKWFKYIDKLLQSLLLLVSLICFGFSMIHTGLLLQLLLTAWNGISILVQWHQIPYYPHHLAASRKIMSGLEWLLLGCLVLVFCLEMTGHPILSPGIYFSLFLVIPMNILYYIQTWREMKLIRNLLDQRRLIDMF